MRKEFLTYGLWMLTLVASLFVVSACQKDDSTYDNTEVMMTFTTRALVSPGDTTSTAIDQERMRKLRVIMVRENGDIVDNHVVENITQTSVTFTFSTPVRTGGEDFTFFAIANEDGLTPTNANELDWLKTATGNNFTEENLNAFKSQTVGTNGSFVLNPNQAIPQTKYWTVEVPQIDKHKLKNQQLDYLTGKISVKFKNQTNQPQSLSDIKLTGIMPNGKGYLFAQASNDYVGQDIGGDISLEAVTNLAAGDSITQNYYTYPIDAANITSPVLHATWKDTNHQETLSKLTSLLRGQHLQIVISLTGQGLTTNYSIADWEEHQTNIGSPGMGGNYELKDWGNSNDIVIGGGGSGGDLPVLPGTVIWQTDNNFSLPISNWQGSTLNLTSEQFDKITAGRILTIETVFNSTGGFRILMTNAGQYEFHDIPSFKNKYYPESTSFSITGSMTFECILTEEDISMIKSGGYITLWGNGYTVTKVLVKEPTN